MLHLRLCGLGGGRMRRIVRQPARLFEPEYAATCTVLTQFVPQFGAVVTVRRAARPPGGGRRAVLARFRVEVAAWHRGCKLGA